MRRAGKRDERLNERDEWPRERERDACTLMCTRERERERSEHEEGARARKERCGSRKEESHEREPRERARERERESHALTRVRRGRVCPLYRGTSLERAREPSDNFSLSTTVYTGKCKYCTFEISVHYLQL